MPFKKQFGGLVDDAQLNKNTGNFSYWIHRITGIGLSIYLLMHTFVLSSAISGPEKFTERMGFVQNPLFALLEILLLAGLVFHLLNGLRITLVDFLGWTRYHKLLFGIVVVIFLFVMICVVILQVPKFDIGNYGGGG